MCDVPAVLDGRCGLFSGMKVLSGRRRLSNLTASPPHDVSQIHNNRKSLATAVKMSVSIPELVLKCS